MSLETKIETTRYLEESEIPKKEIAAKFERLPNSFNTILKNNSEIIKNFETSDLNLSRKWLRSGEHDSVDSALYIWFDEKREMSSCGNLSKDSLTLLVASDMDGSEKVKP